MTENFIAKSRSIHGDKYDYSKTIYISSEKKVTIKCPKHGEFEQIAGNHSRGHGCKKCGEEHVHKKRTLTTEKFIENAKLIHGDKFDYSKVKYIKKKTEIIIVCQIHGAFKQSPTRHLSSEYGCTQCGLERNRSSTDEFIKKAIDIHGNKYEYSKINYINSQTQVIITCERHGDFEQKPSQHLKGSGCQKCASSGYSAAAIKWLKYIEKKENITIQHAENGGEYIISNSNYKADGYCETNNTIYEFNGCFYHGCPECFDQDDINSVCKKSNEQLYNSTLKKEDFIRSQGYNLITIWEHEWNLIKNNVDKILNRPKFIIKLKNLNK